MSASEVKQWFQAYDEAEIEEHTDSGGTVWSHCYASDLPRAVRTAEIIYNAPVYQRPELREIPVSSFTTTIKLPFWWWSVLIRASWFTNAQVRRDIQKAKARINEALDEVISSI